MRNLTDKLQNKILPQRQSPDTPFPATYYYILATKREKNTHFNSPRPPTLMSPCLFLKMPSAECSHVNAAVTNTLPRPETVSFTFILCLGMGEFLLQCKTAGGTVQNEFLAISGERMI